LLFNWRLISFYDQEHYRFKKRLWFDGL